VAEPGAKWAEKETAYVVASRDRIHRDANHCADGLSPFAQQQPCSIMGDAKIIPRPKKIRSK
jgi:hypothetical protein